MSTDTSNARPKHPRPSVVSMACLFVGITAVLTLVELTSALTNWGTVGMQEALQPLRKGMAAAGTEVTTAELLATLRWCALALIPFTVSASVFAVYAFRGDRGGRVATSALAVVGALVSVTSIAVLGAVALLQSSMLLLAAGALWSPESSRWYRGLPSLKATSPEPPPTPSALAAPDGSMPPPSVVDGSAPPPPPAWTPQLPQVRPTSVLAASIITIIGAITGGGFATIFLLIYNFQRAAYIEAAQSGPFGDLVSERDIEMAMTVLLWVSVALLPLAVAGVLGATALLLRRPVGRTVTLVWAGASAALGVPLLPLGLLVMAGAGAVIVLLFRDDARRWTSTG